MISSRDTHRIKVMLCWHWDPFSVTPGGIGRFLEDFIEYAPSDFDIWLPVLTEQTHPLFQPMPFEIRNKVCTVIPVAHTPNNRLIPGRIHYALGLRKFSQQKQVEDYVIHYHGIEPWYGFAKNSDNSHFLILHKNPSYRWQISSESKWRFIPRPVYDRAEQKMVVRSDGLFFVNQQCYEEYAKKYGYLHKPMTLMSTWVDPETFYLCPSETELNAARTRNCEKFGLPENKRLVLYFGRFDEVKDPLLLIQAWRQVLSQSPDSHLLLVGSGGLQTQMHQLIRELQLTEDVTILPSQPREVLRELLWISKASVLPSKSEGMSMAINESLASGCPAVGFDVGDIRRVVEPGVSGEIVTQRDPNDFAEAVSRVLGNRQQYSPVNCGAAVASFNPSTVLKPLYQATQQFSLALRSESAA
ncbi:MAG: glycosyltransferase family 4 protein [Pseudomonadota bacterium]